MKNENDILVSICCITYNHAPYIRQCLDGFLMQKTNFKFEIIIHDDCSTDGTTEIVREYADKYPELIIPIFQTVNQYQNGIKRILASFVYPKANGKYYAICEGDDYWIDPEKLQKQVDYLEEHPECTMTCCRALLFSQKDKKIIGEQYCQKHNGVLDPKDIINRTGLYIPTCSIVHRRNIMSDYPDYCMKCAVGDYPLQIFCAMKGEIYYFDNPMCAYRINNSASWMSTQKWGSVTDERLAVIRSRVLMLKGFVGDYPHFRKVLEGKIADEINRNVPNWRLPDDVHKYLKYFEEDIKRYNLRWKMDLAIIKCRIPLLRLLHKKIFLKKYMQLRTIY